MKNFFTTCFAMLFAVMLSAQSAPNFFKEVEYSQISLPEKAETVNLPSEYITYSLDLDAMRNHLRSAPAEGSADARAGILQVQLPMPDGRLETFKVWESSVMHPELAAKFPMIKTFAGRGITNPVHTVRLGYGEDGFHAMVKSENGGSGVVPYANNQTQYYVCAAIPDLVNAEDLLPLGHTEDDGHEGETPILDNLSPADPQIQLRGGGEGELAQLRIYQYALACTGEFANLHGGTISGVMSAFVTSTDIVNTIFEPEHAIRLILVPNEEELIFLDPGSDPYSQLPYSDQLFAQNEMVLNQKVGIQHYDIGHLFTSYPCSINQGGTTVGIGGQAGGQFCATSKARGYSCHASNNIVAFSYGVAAHELAHQLSASHSFSNCPGTYQFAVAASNAYEPGSGSTIMSYRGACPGNNIPGSDGLYYHGSNIEEVWEYTNLSGGNVCPTLVETSNHTPQVEMPYEDGFYIPVSTPFELYVNATDEDGDALTYCWEQMNLGPQTELGFPIGTAPSFRSFDPVTSPLRVFPKLPTILANSADITEVLPAYSRNLKFRCTVRDNNIDEGAGGVTWEQVSFNATASAGPFLVTYPNDGAVQWKSGEEVEVTWDVANTDNELVKCHAVNIRLSVDGGLTYPHLLISATPNDGAEKVFIPNLTSNNARIRVEASQNIFFDISNQSFQIQPADEPGYTVSLNPQWQQTCVPDNAVVELQTGSILNFDTPLELEIIDGLPAGVDVVFSQNPVMPGENVLITLNMDNVTADGLFEVELRAVAGVDTVYRTLFFNVVYSDFTALALEGPADGQSSLGLLPDFSWTDLPQADAYDFQLSISPGFEPGTIIDEAFSLTDAFYTPDTALTESRIYFWRVRPSNECGKADYTTAKAFQTFTISCVPHVSTDIPQNIPSLGLPVIQSVIPIIENGTISDLNVGQLKGEHDALADIEVKLISPAGTEVILFSQICGNVSKFNFGLNDESPFEIECPPLNSQVYKPEEPLANFIGESTLGNWTLQLAVVDPQGEGGTLQNWNLEFCASVSPNHPYLVNDDTIYIKPLETRLIHNYELAVEDTDNPGNELQFTVVDATDHGYVSRDGEPLGIGDHFTMTDIHLQKMTYTNTNPDAVYDFFTFIVEDGTGGWLGTPRVNIVIDENALTSVNNPDVASGIFLFPNPASDRLTVAFQQPLESEGAVIISDVNGRLVSQQNAAQGQQQLHQDLSGFADGIYFLTVRTAGSVFAKKFIVQH